MNVCLLVTERKDDEEEEESLVELGDSINGELACSSVDTSALAEDDPNLE